MEERSSSTGYGKAGALVFGRKVKLQKRKRRMEWVEDNVAILHRVAESHIRSDSFPRRAKIIKDPLGNKAREVV